MLLVLVLTYVRCAHLCAISTEPGLGIICCLAIVQAVVFAPAWVSRLVSPGRASATRLIDFQGIKQLKFFFDTCAPIVKPKNFLSLHVVGLNTNAGGIYLFWKMLQVDSHISRHAG
eukprot:6263598-Ditylum_brightwellii.AAC.1